MSAAAQNVIGGLLCDNAAYWRIADIVRAEDFPQDYRGLFARIAEAAANGETYDSVTALDDGYDFALDLAANTVGTANIEGWARRIADASETRKVRDAGRRIATCESYEDAQTILGSVRPQQMAKVKSVRDGLGEMAASLQRRFDADGMLSGVPTGVESLDLLTGGWQPGNLVIVAGRPGMGKTAYALQNALAAGRTLYFSLEMTAGELIERAVANVGQLPHKWIRFPKDAPDHAMQLIAEASRSVSELPLKIDDSAARTVDGIAAIARQAHMADPLRMIVVDHLGLIARPGRHDASELGAITAALKRLAKETAPVLLLCQLNRSLESRTDRRPVLADLRDSGRIEEDADVVMAVYRDEEYQPDGPLAGYVELILRKNRSGEKKTAWARAMLGQMRLESCDAPERPISEPSADGRRGGISSRFRARSQSSAFSRAGEAD